MKLRRIITCIALTLVTASLFALGLGDVNSNSTIDIVDALMTAQYSVGLNPANFSTGNADVDCNGTVNIVDALQIAQYYVGLLSKFSCAATPTPTPGPVTSLFCKFRWGMNSGSGTIPSNIDLISIWVGYETDDGMNAAVSTMLNDVKSNRPNVVPVYYSYFIAFKASIRGGLGDCNTDSDGHNLCNEGAQWIRNNRAYIMQVYNSYASMTANIWGTSRPIIWLIEPDFIQYTYAEQTQPFSLAEVAVLANEIIDTVKARLPNAVISMFHATWTYGVANYWSNFTLSKFDMINTTGMADQNGYFNNGDAAGRSEATYSFLHQTTGKPILVDTSFGVTQQNNTWSNATAATLNARISEGVFSALIEPAPANYESQITALNPQLNATCH